MSTRKICCLVLLVLGLLAIAVSVIVILAQPKCAPGSYLHAAVAADTEICSDIGKQTGPARQGLPLHKRHPKSGKH
uniref:Chemokine interleukin-8-like domain-containing protein n=1 Tax=Gopherus agassizii TaxID=38772 RepID=A0A452IWY3_9SAUR